MSLRDELVQVLGNDLADAAMPIIERALAAERAATTDRWRRFENEMKATKTLEELRDFLRQWVNKLETDRSALDEMLAQAEQAGRDAAGEPMECGHAAANLQPCDEGPEVCVVCHLLALARAEGKRDVSG